MTNEHRMRVTVLGTRGSIPVSGSDYVVFGGSTSCYLVEAGDERVILDAGSGLVRAPSSCPHDPVILLSHLHIDHLLGLGMYERLSQWGKATRMLVPARNTREAREVIERLYAPPLWPLPLSECGGDLQIDALPQHLRIGEAEVETARGNHPGGSALIKVCYAGKTLVYATDFEHGAEASARLADFCRGADMLIYDGQYGEEEYDARRGYGHSTPREGVTVMERAGVKRLLIVHHDPHSTDSMLLAHERAMGRADVHFAREGETIEL